MSHNIKLHSIWIKTKDFVSAMPSDDVVVKERLLRDYLIAFAPTCFVTVLYPMVYVLGKLYGVVPVRGNVGWYLVGAIFWLLVMIHAKNWLYRSGLTKTNRHAVCILYDFPVLVLGLAWFVYCFWITGGVYVPFSLCLYALVVDYGASYVSSRQYRLATHLFGFGFGIFAVHLGIDSTVREDFLRIYFESFASLYLGLYFRQIQSGAIYLIKLISSVLERLVKALANSNPDPPQ